MMSCLVMWMYESVCSTLTSNTNSVVHSVFPPIPVLQYVFGEILITNNWSFVFLLFILSQNGFQKTIGLAQFLAFYEPRKKCTVFFGTPYKYSACYKINKWPKIAILEPLPHMSHSEKWLTLTSKINKSIVVPTWWFGPIYCFIFMAWLEEERQECNWYRNVTN